MHIKVRPVLPSAQQRKAAVWRPFSCFLGFSRKETFINTFFIDYLPSFTCFFVLLNKSAVVCFISNKDHFQKLGVKNDFFHTRIFAEIYNLLRTIVPIFYRSADMIFIVNHCAGTMRAGPAQLTTKKQET